jgi:hypothetical protein
VNKAKPRAAVRRFDVFAEYNRLKGLKEEGLSAAQAKGYGLWLAKVVAAQKFGRLPRPSGEKKGERKKTKWHELSGVPQTDKLFNKEIVDRLGKAFYSGVFAPAVREAYQDGKSYEEIRDSIRRSWKP